MTYNIVACTTYLILSIYLRQFHGQQDLNPRDALNLKQARFLWIFFFFFTFQRIFLFYYSNNLCLIMCLHVLSSVLGCLLRFPHRRDVRFVFTSSSLQEGLYLIYAICVCLCIVVSNRYCVVFFLFVCLRLVYPMLPDSLDGPFLIGPSIFSNIYVLSTSMEPLKENHLILSIQCTHVVLELRIRLKGKEQ